MRYRNFFARALVIAACAEGATRAAADTVEKRDGTILSGKYGGGTAGTIRLETPQGIVVIQTADVLALTFTGGPPAGAGAAAVDAAAPPPAPAPAAATPQSAPPNAAAVPVTVPAGTVLTIRVESPVSSNDPPGKTFTAKLLADLMAGDVTVAKAGATVHGQVEKAKKAGRLAGKSQLSLTLTGIDLGGSLQPIMTTDFAEAGKGEFRKTARNIAGGALIGNAIDDSGGGGAGAAVGAGVSLIKKGDAVQVPAGAFLEFRLTQSFQTTNRVP